MEGLAKHTNSLNTVPFEDLQDPTNLRKIENSLKTLQINKVPSSESSFSSGSGNYDKYDRSDAEKSSDSDIQRIKRLTHERKVKETIMNDLKRIDDRDKALEKGIMDATYADEDVTNDFKGVKT